MAAVRNPSWDNQQWQLHLQQAVTQVTELLELLQLPADLGAGSEDAVNQFKLRVPRGFVAKMKQGDAADPLLKQVLPTAEELVAYPGFTQDPLQEAQANPIPGLLHKYHGRVLLTVTGACGINCRYCFRRHFPYQDNNPGLSGWQQALDYIRQDISIKEVIFSGGDPLVANDDYLRQLIEQLSSIPQLTTLRIHTRMPIVLPERITPNLLSLLSSSSLKVVLVTHCNHAQELDDKVAEAMACLQAVGVTLLNQSVLLKGVNDSAKTLARLSERLFQCHIMPYYLHLLDKVAGSGHFDVSESSAKALMDELYAQVPGYLVPKLVKEVPGKGHKVVII